MPVNTVTGTMSAKQLGTTLMHEHMVFGFPGYQGDMTLGGFDHEMSLQTCKAMAAQLTSVGVQSIVDATPNECGRDPEFLREVSGATGLNIICSTGYYYEGAGAPAYFKFRATLGDIEQEIYDMFMTEITLGIGGTGIKAGVLKLASSKQRMTEYEQAFFRTAAKVQQDTGLPIITHTQEGTLGPEQAEFLLAERAHPEKIMIGHMDGNTDVTYHLKTLAHGVSIAFDRCGLQKVAGMPLDQERVTLLSDLISKGYAHRIMLSSDTVWNWLGRPPHFSEGAQKLLAHAHPMNIFERIIPALKQSGVTPEHIEIMLVDNPRRLFSGHAAISS